MVWEVPIRSLRSLTAAVLLLGSVAPAYGQTPDAAPGGASAKAAAPAPAAAPPAAGDTAPSAVVVDQAFALGVGDVVDVGVIGRTDFNVRVRVSTEGTIVLPLLGRVKAVGLTTSELAQQTQDALAKGGFYSNPVVRVEVTGVASRYATVLGNVATPGLMPLDRTYHLSDVIAKVGAHTGEGASFVVLTRADGTSKKYSMEDLATGGGGADPLVMAGDKIYVPAATSEVFYISGQVKNPGSFPITKELTVREAIAKGGGLTDMGSDKKIKVFRKNEEVKGVKLDTKLEPGDILQVGERLF
ncbi:SLBB domain-containing protein [Phenylobacterium sp.]|uniref:SLBB domain-containing protein n=1 Tax=Phenylobacterium sp. TaxID=1871053 RepID=UPI0035658CB9